MLVITRRPGQSFLIGRDIEVIVLDSVGGSVRIGVRAPRDVPILRDELRDQVLDENRRAVAARLDLPALAEEWSASV
jgi:carbon storage regulator